jgi:hypothetical protein
VKLETLGIYIESDPGFLPQLQDGFENELNDFIEKYNASGSKSFLLKKSDNPATSSIRIRLMVTQLVTPSQQTTGIVVSVIGLVLPFVMIAAEAEFALAFWYFPHAKSLAEISLSDDINEPGQKPFQQVYSSPGFLKDSDQQIEKHISSFDKFLRLLVRQVKQQ